MPALPTLRKRLLLRGAAAPLLLLVAAILLRGFAFVPAVIDTDEGLYMVQAREWLREPGGLAPVPNEVRAAWFDWVTRLATKSAATRCRASAGLQAVVVSVSGGQVGGWE